MIIFISKLNLNKKAYKRINNKEKVKEKEK
jgi:hypothetical protein